MAPEEAQRDGLASDRLAAGLRLVASVIRWLEEILGQRPPLNVWLHDGNHWHLELVPRLSTLAGLELGAEIYVNSVGPETAAARLRDARAAVAARRQRPRLRS